MKLIQCERCGGNDFYNDKGYRVCKFCGARFVITMEDVGIKETTISLNSDIELLLKKCKQDPTNARRYANLVLDIDPSNQEALKYI